MTEKHQYYIKRCLQIAKNGLGTTRPNPMVGAVIVLNDTIIGEGFTSPYGGPHAEVNAITAVNNKADLSKATLYVTLEPCSHYGKTPPCTDLIIEHKIPHVVLGCVDDNPEVAGKGIKKLKDSGCDVTINVLEAECKLHHRRFFTFQNKKRPYIILKWAESTDGYIAPQSKSEQKPIWITNPYSRQLVHKWRAEEQAIMVGANTVLEDNPSLTVRDWSGNNPIRVVLDKELKLDTTSNVFDDKSSNVIFCDDNDLLPKPEENQKGWSTQPPSNSEISAAYIKIDWSKSTQIAKQICDGLIKFGINSMIIEGGTSTLQTFINEGLWDEARVFTGKIQFKKGIKAPSFSGHLSFEDTIKEDNLKIYING